MRAPWRWRWGQILGLTLLWSVIGAAIGYAPVLGIVLAVWFTAWVREALKINNPSPTTGVDPLEGKEAGHRVVKSGNGAVSIVYLDAERRHTTCERSFATRTAQSADGGPRTAATEEG
jgi:hypothetical protein